MSRNLYVRYRDAGFWAYDVAVGILLKHLIDVAEERSDINESWIQTCVETWRINILVNEYGLYLDEDWSEIQIEIVIEMLYEACDRLENRESISAREMERWDVIEGGVEHRGASHFPTAPILKMGQAIEQLLTSSLPRAPKGTWWYYGVEGIDTMSKFP
jgi:hypothetical protein